MIVFIETRSSKQYYNFLILKALWLPVPFPIDYTLSIVCAELLCFDHPVVDPSGLSLSTGDSSSIPTSSDAKGYA